MKLRRITAAHATEVVGLLTSVPEGDRTFFKEPIDHDTVRRWALEPSRPRWVLEHEGVAIGYLAVLPGVGWSSHVGELRLIVHPDHRRRGIGTALARRGLIAGVELGLRKLTVEVVADKRGDVEMFVAMGFRPEGLLEDHIRDADGSLRDLVMLSHQVDEVATALSSVGIDEEVGVPLGPEPRA